MNRLSEIRRNAGSAPEAGDEGRGEQTYETALAAPVNY